MDATAALPLIDRLQLVAALWVDAHAEPRPTLARLGRRVVNDGGFFTRLESPAAATTTTTLEKFAGFLADPANWPADEHGGRAVPREAIELAHVTGIAPAVAPCAVPVAVPLHAGGNARG